MQKSNLRRELERMRELIDKEPERIAKPLRATVTQMQEQLDEIVAELNKKENVRLAEVIHDKRCNWNHTDGCGWYYESWENPGSSRLKYLERADEVLEHVPFETALTVIEHI